MGIGGGDVFTVTAECRLAAIQWLRCECDGKGKLEKTGV